MTKSMLATLLLSVMFVSGGAVGEAQECGCDDPVDLAILVDRSASISSSDYDDARRLVREFAGRFTVSEDDTHVLIAQFDVDTEVVLEFYQGVTLLNIDAAVNTMSCSCVGTLDFSVRPWEVLSQATSRSWPKLSRNNRGIPVFKQWPRCLTS